MRGGGIRHDGQAKPGPGQPTCGRRPVEPVEDPGAVLRRDPRALIGDDNLAGSHGHVDPPLCRGELHRVVQQVRHRPFQHVRASVYRRRDGGHHDLNVLGFGAPAHPVGRDMDDLGQISGLDVLGGRLVTGQLDQLTDQSAQFPDLRVHVPQQGVPVGRGQCARRIGLGPQQ